MRVVIKEKEYDYVSDFPDGWVFSKGDYFKVVKIFDKHTCFIKRFEVKTPANISGWKLMVNLKGKNENNLSRLYDIAETRESEKNIYCDKKGRFVLIDLDSAQPASEAPNNDMWGEK